MFNMASMAREECASDPEEIRYAKWLAEVNKLLDSEVYSDDLAFDLYSDNCTPQEAVDEILANG
mgnify:CR=1 FL=1